MSTKVGFANAVRRHGDRWRVESQFEAWERGDDLVADAICLSDGYVSDDEREAQRMDYLLRNPDHPRAEEC